MKKVNKKSIFLLLLISIVVFVSIFLIQKISAVYSDVKTAIAEKNKLMIAIDAKDIGAVKSSVSAMHKIVGAIKSDLGYFRFVAFVPGVRSEIYAAQLLTVQADYLLDSADLAIKILQETGIDIFTTSIDVTNASVLRNIDLAVLGNKQNIANLAKRGDELNANKGAVSNIQQIKVLQEKIASYSKVVSQVIRLIATTEDGAASLFGLRGEKRYLLLIQNSDELRPGGGIISTYGLIDVKDGQTSNLTIDHVKNLGILYTLPLELNPTPVQQTMRHQENLYIYDANWPGNPSAWLEKIYRSWNAQKPPVDGVIVMSTKILESVVSLYEPIKLPGTNETFLAEDIIASLDYYFDVEHDLYDLGKYKVLAPLVDELLTMIKTSDLDRLQKLMSNTKKSFQSRDLFVYTEEQAINDALKNNGIQNDMPPIMSDEFYALEANLGSGKADARMKRSLKLDVYAQENQPVTIAKITHDYTSGITDFRAGGYYGYLRLFLPIGSKLGTFEGFNKVEDENVVEAGRQVYGNYYSVATGTKKDTVITYALAESVAEQIKNGSYSLMLRKQGGVEMPFEIKIYIPDSWKNPKITTTDGTSEFAKNNNNLVTWKGTLTKDMQIEIKN